MKRTGIIFILGLLLASLSWAQNGDNPAFDSVTFPVFSLNPAPVPGASIALVGQPGQATWYFWASANYQLGSVVSYLGSVSNAPNTLSGSNYISIIPTGYPGGVLTVDILATTGPLAPVGACNCAIATGLTSGGTNFQSNTLSSYSVSILNPQAFNLRLTNEVTGTGAVSLVLRNAYTGALICIVSAGCGGGSGVPITTVAGLASVPGKTNGTIAVVTDGNSLTDCTTGGSATNVLCQYNGTSWYAIVSAGTPGGSDAQLQFNHLGAFAGIANVAPGSLLASTSTTSPPAPQVKLVVDMRDGVNGVAGVKCDGTADDTAAIQNYLNYYGKGGSGAANVQFQLPIGNCVISNEVVYEGTNSLGMRLVGGNGFSGAQQPPTALVWNGPNFGSMMLILGCNGCDVENIAFVSRASFLGFANAQNTLWFDASNTVTPATYNLSSITRSGNVVTATTSTTHAVTPGRIVKVASSTGGTTSFNGTFQVLYSNSNTTISWIQKGANESGAASTGTITNYQSAPSNNIMLSHIQATSGEAVQSTISAISGQNPVAVTTSTPHFIQNGDTVCLRSVIDTSYIGCYLAAVTSSTTANLTVLPFTGLSPSGTASSGGTLLSGSSGIRFAHPDPITEQVSGISGAFLYISGDATGGSANCFEADVAGNTKNFVFSTITASGCRYTFNGFASGNFTLVGYSGEGNTTDLLNPTLASSEFVNMNGQIFISGVENEPSYGRFFLGGGNIHLDTVSFQASAPPDDQIIRWSGSLTITSSIFQNGRASNANTILQAECGLQFISGNCSLISIGNFYSNAATGGSWTNAPFIPLIDGSGNTFFACPGSVYCNVPVNVQSFGDLGSTANNQNVSLPLNDIGNLSNVIISNALRLANPVLATSGSNQSSPTLNFCDSFYAGGSQPNCWNVQDLIGAGSAPTTTLRFTQTGSTGPAAAQFPALQLNAGANLSLSQDAVYGAGVLDIGNGPMDMSGTAQLTQINFPGTSGNLSSFLADRTQTPRNDHTQAEGFQFSVLRAITVSQLGRRYIAGNTQDHVVNLWVSTNTVTPIASGTVLASSSADGLGIKWVAVTPVVLTPGNLYAIGVDETTGGDTWLDYGAASLQPELGPIGAREGTGPSTYLNGYGPIAGAMYDNPAMTFTTAIPVSGISQLAPASLAIGNSTPGDFSGSLKLTHLNAVGDMTVNGAKLTSTAGVPSANCNVGDFDTNTSASSASTVFYICYPLNTWNAVTVP